MKDASKEKPPQSPYVQVYKGHLYKEGKRLRLWGVALPLGQAPFPPPKPYEWVEHTVGRLERMGFNAIHLYHNPDAPYWTLGETKPMQNSQDPFLDWQDLHDFTIAESKKRNIVVISNAFSDIPRDWFLPPHTSPGDPEWTNAVKGAAAKTIYMASYFDTKLAGAIKNWASSFLNHVNPHTQVSYALEKTLGMYYFGDERGFATVIFGGILDPLIKHPLEAPVEDRKYPVAAETWPAYFANQVKAQWNQWLAKKYGTTQALVAAWGGAGVLEADESLEQQSLKPFTNGYPSRLEDLMRFLYEKEQDALKDLIAHIRSQAPAGVGANVVPIAADIVNTPDPHLLYANAAIGDAAIFDNYNFMITYWLGQKYWKGEPQPEPWWVSETRTFPNGIEEPPKKDPSAKDYKDYHYGTSDENWTLGHSNKFPTLSWASTATIVGKPNILLTNVVRPARYRSEFPMRAAIWASWLDWDGVLFFLWGPLPTFVKKVDEHKSVLGWQYPWHYPGTPQEHTYPFNDDAYLDQPLWYSYGAHPDVFLFTVGPEYQSDLDQGVLSQGFRQEFQDHGISLSPNDKIKIQPEPGGKKWVITDEGKGQAYIVIKQENGALNVHKAMTYCPDTDPDPVRYDTHGLQFVTDEVFLSQSLAAAEVFRRGYIAPAPSPTTVTYGKHALLRNPMSYHTPVHKHPDYIRTAFTYGLQFDFDLDEETIPVKVNGPIANKTEEAVKPSKQITYDWPDGRIIVDTPLVKAFLGFNMGKEYNFKNKITMGKTNTNYTNFVLVSRDGWHLAFSKDMLLSVVSTAENDQFAPASGCENWPSKWPPGGSYGRQFVWNLDGKAVVDRVGTLVSFPKPVTAQGFDFAMRPIDLLPSASPNIVVISAQQPIFIETIHAPLQIPKIKPPVAIDPLALVLSPEVYVMLTLPDPPPFEQILARVEALGPEERTRALTRIRAIRYYLSALEKELRKG